jgi:hypothetical protein
MHFDFWPLLFLVQAVLDFQVVKPEDRLKDTQIIDVSVDPIEAFGRRGQRCLNILDYSKYALVYQTDFHPLPLLSSLMQISRMPAERK